LDFIWKGDMNMDKLKCKIGFKTVGFTEKDKDGCYNVNINQNDIVDADQYGYLWKDGICFAHKDSKIGKENFIVIES
jgi:hypothetical protein